MPRPIDAYMQRQSIIDVAKEMSVQDMFDIMGERFKTDWYREEAYDWRNGQRFMNSLTAVQYEALTGTEHDTFYVNEFYSIALAVVYLMALELV